MASRKKAAEAPTSYVYPGPPSRPTPDPRVRELRATLDNYIAANADRPLGDCHEELLDIMNMAVKRGFDIGAIETKEGMIEWYERNS